jgi:hypothetical protein
MNTTHEIDDPLFAFELMVARRADELAHDGAHDEKSAFELWCDAEREILASEISAPAAFVSHTLEKSPR